jgi:hypothetical protein
MLVDPETGMPIQNMGQSIGSDVLGAYGVTPSDHATLFSVLNGLPTAKQTAGWNAWRASRTVTHGGFSRTGGGMVRNHLSPRSWTRFTSGNIITGAADSYTPFNSLSWAGNRVAHATMGRISPGRAGRMGELGLSDGYVSRKAQKDFFFSAGTYPLISSSMSIARTSNYRKLSNATRFVRSQDPALFEAASSAVRLGATGSSRDIAGLVSAVPTGRYSQLASGYMAGARGIAGDELIAGIEASRPAWASGARFAGEAFEKAGLNAAEKLGMAGARTLVEEAGAKGAAVLGARTLGYAIPGVNIAMAAWTAYDILKMGTTALKGSVEFGKDAMISMRGSIQKPVMGMGYKDNTVAATSRARGVMAIQNSQLNARSVLGNEGAMLAAHFG